MSTFWSIWIIVLTLASLAGCVWILFANRKIAVRDDLPEGEPGKTGHVYDGIEEYDNPLPGWWFNMFMVTVIFALVYLVLFPGLGNFKGLLGWSSAGKWQAEVSAAEEKYGPVFAQFSATPVEELIANPEAMKIGQRLFNNNCSVCHGSDGRGSYGFPNLADDDWLYGSSIDAIRTSITNGRKGAMPAWGSVIGEEGVDNVAEYVFQLSGRDHNSARAEKGASVFQQFCTACHGPEGKGMQALGAPNLTDGVWLYGGTPSLVRHSIRAGRNGNMPAQKEQLHPDKINLVAAYVYRLSKVK